MYISYSGFKKLDSCAFSYWLDYIHKPELLTPDDRLGSIFGSVTGRLFERFYTDQAWRTSEPLALVMSWVPGMLTDVLREETTPSKYRKAGVLLWEGMEGANRRAYANREAIEADVRDTIPRGFRVIRKERLLGPRAEAEVKLDSTVGNHRIGGRADFVIRRAQPFGDLTITDGKGSAYRDKYVDPQQLFWYSWLLQEKEGVLPDRVGFIFWRYEGRDATSWFEVTQKDVDDLKQHVVTTLDRVEREQRLLGSETGYEAVAEVFKKTPNDENCKFCPYGTADICPEGLAAKKKKPAKNRLRVV